MLAYLARAFHRVPTSSSSSVSLPFHRIGRRRSTAVANQHSRSTASSSFCFTIDVSQQSWQQYRITTASVVTVSTRLSARRSSSEDGGSDDNGTASKRKPTSSSAGKKKEKDGQGQGPGGSSRGRGPRNRRTVLSQEEEEFAAMSATSFHSPPPSRSDDDDNDATDRPTRASSSSSAAAARRVAPIATPKKRPSLTIDPNWKPKAASYAASRGKSAAASRVIIEDDDDDMFELPKDLVVRGLDDASYKQALEKAGLSMDDDDDEEEEDEEEEEYVDDEDDDDDDDEEYPDDDDDDIDVSLSAPSMSMEDRLRMAQSGNLFNPFVRAMHRSGGARGEAAGGQGEGDDDDDDDDDDDSDSEKDGMMASPKPVKYQYKIVMDVGTCPGCGNSFQTKNESSPGFLPVDVYQRLQRKLTSPKKKMTPRAMKGDDIEDDLLGGISPEEEVEMLLKGKDPVMMALEARVGNAAAILDDEEEDEHEKGSARGDDREDDTRTVICQRCHKLKHYGEVEDTLRPGWSDNELLTPERFRDLVSVVRKKRCGVVCLIDIFDFHGSLLYNLPRIVGENPVLVAVNKADLLPADFSEERVRIWVKQELEKIGMKDINTRNIFLISCKTGNNVKPLLRAMKTLARQRKRDLYVIGAANVGKSTFINRLIEIGRSGGAKKSTRAGAAGKKKETGTLVTTSALPGTTLNFIEVDLGDKVSLYDTPGLILPHQLTTLLTTDELKAVIPQKRINHVTLRLAEGKSVLLGGLVRLDMVEGRPFLFTFYASNEVKLHQTRTDKADEFLEKHIGELVFPPWSKERLEELGKMVPREFEIEGTGWKTSAIDIVISGLGWISVTGALNCKVRVMAPESVGVRLRSPLMPYETWDTTAKWTGLRAVKGNKKKGGSR